MNDQSIRAEARKLRDLVSQYVNIRLSRGSLRIQGGAFASESEWRKRRSTQGVRIARINERLKTS